MFHDCFWASPIAFSPDLARKKDTILRTPGVRINSIGSSFERSGAAHGTCTVVAGGWIGWMVVVELKGIHASSVAWKFVRLSFPAWKFVKTLLSKRSPPYVSQNPMYSPNMCLNSPITPLPGHDDDDDDAFCITLLNETY